MSSKFFNQFQSYQVFIFLYLPKNGKKVSVKIIKVGKSLFLQAKLSLEMFLWLLGRVKGIMGMPKRFAVFGLGFFRVSDQDKQNLSKADTSLKWTKILVL